MKIRRKADENGADNITVQQTPGANAGAVTRQKTTVVPPTVSEDDTVDVSLARSISQQLDPAQISDERRKKVENLKQLIAAGKYNPPSEDVARAVGEEIIIEILSRGGSKQDDLLP